MTLVDFKKYIFFIKNIAIKKQQPGFISLKDISHEVSIISKDMEGHKRSLL